MFARTERLMLRPGWLEDAPALATAISGGLTQMSDLCWGRWPSVPEDAERWLRHARDPSLPSLLVLSRTRDAPELIGGTGLHRMADGSVELDFWINPDHRARGFATEAARAMLGIAQALGLRQLAACVFSDNGAAGRVLQKLGFSPSGLMARQSTSALRYSRTIDPARKALDPLLAA